MIKRNPLVKTKSQTTRKKEVKELLSDVGMNFFDDKEWEEFQVWPIGDKRGGDSTYFTIKRSSEDLEDALRTGLDMAKRLGKGKPKFLVQNPSARKCRTFQVKRKVGKRVIKVTRKVCRNPNPLLNRSHPNVKLLRAMKDCTLINDKNYIIAYDEDNNRKIKYDIIRWNKKKQKEFANKDVILSSNDKIIPHYNVIEIYGPFEYEVDAREWLG